MSEKQYSYQKASLWYVLSLVISTGNDAMTKYIVSLGIAPGQITFYRVVLGLAVLTIYIVIYNPAAFCTKHLGIHMVRGGFFFIASLLWSYGLGKASVASATTIGFTVPLFVLIFARILLKEQVNGKLWLATLIGFLATMMIVFDPERFVVNPSGWQLNVYLIAFCIAALLFALLDIINKKYIDKEPMLSMLFYSNLMASLFGIPFVNIGIFALSINQGILLLLLSIGGLGILFCLLKAYTYAPISLLAPLRYIELFIACIIDYVCFNHVPTLTYILGASILIAASLFVTSRHNSV